MEKKYFDLLMESLEDAAAFAKVSNIPVYSTLCHCEDAFYEYAAAFASMVIADVGSAAHGESTVF